MTNILEVENRMITLRGRQVILDSDVAELYGVQTKEINQAVRNNPRKFPNGYIFQLDNQEFSILRSKFLTTSFFSSSHNSKMYPFGNLRGLFLTAWLISLV